MLLEGSCHCGAVHFSVESEHPYPFNLCYCSICRKTAGAGGFAINLGGQSASLKVQGKGTSASTGRESQTLAKARASVRWNAVSAVNAAACYGAGTRDGPISSIPSRRPSTPSSLSRPNART
jgi:hypothetical protein